MEINLRLERIADARAKDFEKWENEIQSYPPTDMPLMLEVSIANRQE